MTSHKSVFKCASCGEVLPASMLSNSSLEEAGTRSKSIALAVLESPECEICEDVRDGLDWDEVDFMYGERQGMTDVERFNFSGTQVDPGWLSAYRTSH